MGFIEKEEQKARERNKKSQEDAERERRVYQENQERLQERLRLQKNIELGEKKRLVKLRREAKAQFTDLGLAAMLDRLIKTRTIEKSLSDSVVGEDQEPRLPERAWEEMKIKDGLFHTKVIVSDKITYNIGGENVRIERFFNITTDSAGLIIFEYGHKKVQRSEWRKDPNLLEDLLEKAFNSPRTIKTKTKIRGDSGNQFFSER